MWLKGAQEDIRSADFSQRKMFLKPLKKLCFLYGKFVYF